VTRALATGALAIALLFGLSSAASAGTFSLGVAAGEVTSSSAILWGHADQPGRVRLELATNRRFRDRRTVALRATETNDGTVQRRVRGLRPRTRHWFRFRRGHAGSERGTFVTAPRPRANATVRFAWTGDTDLNPAPGQSAPFWNDGGVFRRMRAEQNDFNVHLGDTIYSDSEIPGLGAPALTVAEKWAKYRVNLENPLLRALRRSAGLYSHWDDHEFLADFSPAEDGPMPGRVLYRRGVRAFRDYAPVRYTARDGLYRSFRWGKNLALFLLDERSFRSAKANSGHACDNPKTGRPDLAPTLPQAARGLIDAVLPATGLSAPVSQGCLDTIRSPERRFLGERQLRRFIKAVRRSSARFKVVLNELPIQQLYALPYDRWEGYDHERQRVLRALSGNVPNVVFLTTDVHSTLVGDARFRTLEPGGPEPSAILEVSVGPAATESFRAEVDQQGGQGLGAIVGAAFLGNPPLGFGMRCAVLDRFSYGEVRVTRRALTITPKDIDGDPLAGCPALRLRHE